MNFSMRRAILDSRFILFASLTILPALHAQEKPVPPGAPTAACSFAGARSLDALRILNGDSPVPYVFACGENRPTGQCVSGELKPHSAERLASQVIGVDHTEGTWSCVSADAVSGWVPTDRLSPLPGTPAVPSADWLGWWRDGPGAHGIRNDRILITRSPSNPLILHVSGRAYWYGLGDNVHFGQINADAIAQGPYLHIADGGCMLDLTYNPATHSFSAVDNDQCGGMNVRFTGIWSRFTPRTASHK